MQIKRKMVCYRLIAFLTMAICGALLTWVIMRMLTNTQHFDYPALFEKIHSDAHFLSMLDTWESHLPLVSILFWAAIVVITVLIIKIPVSFATQLELGYLLVIFPLHAILFVCFNIIGYKMSFYFVAMFWLGITDALWLANRLIQWFYRRMLLDRKQIMNQETKNH